MHLIILDGKDPENVLYSAHPKEDISEIDEARFWTIRKIESGMEEARLQILKDVDPAD